MSKRAIPTSKAKTAYGLLSEVRRLILEEPLRYCQGDWLKRLEDYSDANSQYAPTFPACGTIGCVAGWVATLKGPTNQRYSLVSEVAESILGINSTQAEVLFNGSAVGGTSQTREHAKAGATHIANFMQKHAAQLKATRVPSRRMSEKKMLALIQDIIT